MSREYNIKQAMHNSHSWKIQEDMQILRKNVSNKQVSSVARNTRYYQSDKMLKKSRRRDVYASISFGRRFLSSIYQSQVIFRLLLP